MKSPQADQVRQSKFFSPIYFERFALRMLEEDDVPYLVRHLNNWEIVKNLAEIPHPYKAEHGMDFIGISAQNIADRKRWDLAIASLVNLELIGGIAYNPADNHSIGYWFEPSLWGKGFATDVVAGWVDFVIKYFSPPYVAADVNIDNIASKKVLEKNGFVVIGQSIKERPKSKKLVKVYNLQLTRKGDL